MWLHKNKESKLYWRWWLHFSGRKTIAIDLNLWTHFCHLSVEVRDEGWHFSIALPPVAFWITFEGFGWWTPQYETMASWENPPRKIWLTDRREFQIAIHDWTVRFTPWGRWGEWRSRDPWWIRGGHLDIKDFLLGRQKYSDTSETPYSITIPMPEGPYLGNATVQHCTWKRPRWRAFTRTYTKVDIEGGIPFPGKGENSWDCGMDGLWGYSVDGTKPEDAIAKGVQIVLESRRRYGGSVDWRPPKPEEISA